MSRGMCMHGFTPGIFCFKEKIPVNKESSNFQTMSPEKSLFEIPHAQAQSQKSQRQQRACYQTTALMKRLRSPQEALPRTDQMYIP
mmetsp:Transcript_10817/g.17313  ORF Transcript_10817/g.17313 Transcript_10817/m.17313 type:complete len:86 (-) Transcript_10817:1023-1280(-)